MLLHIGQNFITFRTLLHLGSFITFRPSPTNILDVREARIFKCRVGTIKLKANEDAQKQTLDSFGQ